MEWAQEMELVKKAQRGDEPSRDALYRRYFVESKSVRALLARELRNPADRNDLLHDAYSSLLRSSLEFQGDLRLQRLVYREVQIAILRRMRRDRADRKDRTIRLTRHEDYQFEELEAGATAERLFSLLPEPLRTAFRLRVSEELSFEDIAAATQAPVNTVATRIFKAREYLAGLFGAPGENREERGSENH